MYIAWKITALFLNKFIRKSVLLTRLLFGIKIAYGKKPHWDFTTLVFKKALRSTIKSNFDVLEIGTGPHGILSIYLARRIRCNIVASDINSEYVEYAIDTAKLNGVDIGIIKSDLMENVKGKYDIIFWNSVYIPRGIGNKIGMNRISQYETDWCGGESGMAGIERFLASAPPFLKVSGKLMIGFNRLYLKKNEVLALCESLGYSVENIKGQFLNPSYVITVKRRKSGN